MERVSFDISRHDLADALPEQARANGRSVEEELAALVERTYAQPAPRAIRESGESWVDELIRIADGANLQIPDRRAGMRSAPLYPEGMEPLSGETFVEHMTRISRPGIDLTIERDATPYEGPNL